MSVGQKSKNEQQQNKKAKKLSPCRSQELNPGPLAPQTNALPLHHKSTEQNN